MIVVIQCASRKRADAGFMRTHAGTKVSFVADPLQAPPGKNCVYARPDEPSDIGASWREARLQYNREPGQNPLGLRPAFQLYENETYRRFAERFGIGNTYILSAGWGLISAAFLTPYYDITFSAMADAYKRRRKTDDYRDLRMLPDDTREPVVFFGGKDYLPLFCKLTRSITAKRTVFYNSGQLPVAPGCSLVRFPTTTRTNWHYECADAFLDGRLAAETGDQRT